MNPFSVEGITLLVGVLWKIGTGFVFPVAGLFGFVVLIVWLMKKGGVDL